VTVDRRPTTAVWLGIGLRFRRCLIDDRRSTIDGVRGARFLAGVFFRGGSGGAFRACACRNDHHGLSLAFGERRGQGIGQALGDVVANGETVHHHVEVGDRAQVTAQRFGALGGRGVQVQRVTVHEHAHEAQGPQVVHDPGVGGPGAQGHGERDHEARALGQGEHGVGGRLHRVGLHVPAALGAVRASGARVQQTQVVVHLRRRAHRRAAGLGGVLLLDGHGGADAVDEVHRRLLHPLQELLGVRRQRLDVAALALGVDGVEGQRRLAGAAGTRHHHQSAAWQLQVDALEIVLPGVADENAVLHCVVVLLFGIVFAFACTRDGARRLRRGL
jgi:hypothetical protein